MVIAQTALGKVGTGTLASVVSTICWGLLCGYAAFAILSFFGAPVSTFDDAIPLIHGVLVQQGRTPNLDFYSFYPPLNAYVNAAAFTLLGRTVLAARLVTAVLYVALLLLAIRFLRLQLTRTPTLLPITALLFTASIGSAVNLPVFSGFALSLSTLLLYLGAPTVQRNYLPAVFASGVLAGVALLYRVNFGGYAVAVIAIDLLLPDDSQPAVLWRTISFKPVIAFFVPFATTIAAICLWIFGAKTGIAVSQFVVTAQKLMALRGFITLRLSADLACAVLLPCAWFFWQSFRSSDVLSPKTFVAAVLGMSILLLALVRGSSVSVVPIVIVFEFAAVIFVHLFVYRLRRAELSIVLYFCCLLHYFLSRAEWMHWRLLPIAAALLVPFLFRFRATHSERGELESSKATAFVLTAAACFVLFATEIFRPAVSCAKSGARLISTLILHRPMADSEQVLDTHKPRQEWLTVYPDRDEVNALRYLREQTGSSDPIFVGVKDHSRIYWNDLRAYWLTGRPIGVHTFQLEARVASEANVQGEIVNDLRRNSVKWIFLNNAPPRGDDTFMEQAYQGSKMLDEYIASHYQTVAEFGAYSVLKIKDDLVTDLPANRKPG